jgi:hypothetical protein
VFSTSEIIRSIESTGWVGLELLPNTAYNLDNENPITLILVKLTLITNFSNIKT